MRTALFAAALTCALALPLPASAQGVPGQGTWETTLLSRDLDGNGSVDAFYDTVQDVTWLRDTRLAGGTLNSFDARSFAANLVFGGYGDWRLPTLDQSVCNGIDDIYTCGPLLDAHPEASEIGHLYYVTLGNERLNPTNTGGFVGMNDAVAFVLHNYLGGDVTQGPWIFLQGAHWGDECGCDVYDVMVLRDGDVAAVPELPTAALLLAGAFAIAGRRRVRPG